MQKIEFIVLGVLLVVFVYLLTVTFFKSPQKTKVVTPPVVVEKPVAIPEPVMGTVPPAASAVNASNEPGSELKDWGDNPFVVRPAKTESGTGAGGPLQLQGIVIEGEQKPYAVINDRIVTVGDNIADQTVKGIQKNKVILVSKDGKETVLED
jgi:hypothetical protein